MGNDYFGNLQAALNNVTTQQSLQQQYNQGYLGQWTSGGNLFGSSAIGFTGGSITTITVDAPYGIEAKAKPNTNLAWLDEDIARYRVKLAA